MFIGYEYNKDNRKKSGRRSDSEGVHPRGEKVLIANQEYVNEEVPSQVLKGPQAPYVEENMSNVEIMDDFQTLTQLMKTQAQVFTTHAQSMTAQDNQGVGPQPNVSILLEYEIS